MEIEADSKFVLEFLNNHFTATEDLDTKLFSLLDIETKKLAELKAVLTNAQTEAISESSVLNSKLVELKSKLSTLESQFPELQMQIVDLIDREPNWYNDINSKHHSLGRIDSALAYSKIAYDVIYSCDLFDSVSGEEYVDLSLHLKLLQNLKESRTFAQGNSYPGPLKEYLQDILEYRAQLAHSSIQKFLTRRFEATLELMKWPQKIDLGALAEDSSELLIQFRRQFDDLACFQQQSKIIDIDPVLDLPELQINFLPLDIMTKAIIIRFRHHFMGPRPTNSLEKPEWFLSFMTEQMSNHLHFFDDLQPLTQSSKTSQKLDLKQYFAKAMNKLIIHKLNKVRSTLISFPMYLSHFIKELLEFDHNIISDIFEDYPYMVWQNCANVFVGNSEMFMAWIKEEQAFVKKRLSEIMRDPKALESVNSITESNEEDERPTIAADRVSSLFEAITERYALLQSMALRIRYFAEVQLALLEDFYKELDIYVWRYESRLTVFRPLGTNRVTYFTSVVLAQMQGVIDSAYFFNTLLQECDTQPFFLEIWKAINSVGNSSNSDTKGLFEDLTSTFTRLASEATLLVGEGLFKEFIKDLKPWLDLDPWNSANSSLLEENSSSDELTTSLTSLKKYLAMTYKLHQSTRYGSIKVFANKLESTLLKQMRLDNKKLARKNLDAILDSIASFYPEPATLFQNLVAYLKSGHGQQKRL